MTYSQRQKAMKNHYDQVFPYRVILVRWSANFDGVKSEYVIGRCKDEANAKKCARRSEKYHENDKDFISIEIRKVF